MSVAKVIELTADSSKGFEDALRNGIAKAGETLQGIRAAWIANQEVLIEDGKVKTYRVHMRVTFVLND
jgi:flavin-binding protein dodecin